MKLIIITSIIAITLTIWFCIAMKVFYDIRINKEFSTKVKDVTNVIQAFRDSYIDGDGHCGDKGKKFNGTTTDIMNLIRSLTKILNLNLWNL